MELPPKTTRKIAPTIFPKVSEKSWEYLFDHEKENGLVQCRVEGWNEKVVVYDTAKLKKWLIDHCLYLPDDFSNKPLRAASPWSALLSTR